MYEITVSDKGKNITYHGFTGSKATAESLVKELIQSGRYGQYPLVEIKKS